MITIIIYGLDQFVVGDLSREMTPNLAKLYEVSEDQINFIAPSNMVFHNGVDQTSWNAIIHVHAPLKVSVLQEDAARIIVEMIGELAIHKAIEFHYYSQDSRVELINPDYPRFITDENTISTEEDYDDCDCDDCDDELEEGEGENQIFTGDIFEKLK